MDKPARHVVIIGGGIVGAATAEALLRSGARVTVLEPGQPGGEQSASFGNGAFISPASIIPMSMPGLWKQVPGYLLDREGPLTVRWPYIPRLLGWFWRFLRAGATEARVTRTAQILTGLLHGAPALHHDLAARVAAPDLLRDSGLLYLYTDRAAYLADALSWGLRRKNGVAMEEIEGEALAKLAPGLADRYRFGIFLPEGKHCVDPGGYVNAILRACAAQGLDLRHEPATGLRATGGKLTAVTTPTGEIACDAVVIAAGIGSARFAKEAGDHIPLEAERGYHVELPDADLDLPIPVMPQDLKVAIVKTRGGLRVAGQVEFATASAAPDWRRADLLREKVLSCFPQTQKTDPAQVKRWQGNRPSTPDGLPVIGPASGMQGVFYAFGHGHIGLNSGPATGQIIADLISGNPPALDPAPFSATRFH